MSYKQNSDGRGHPGEFAEQPDSKRFHPAVNKNQSGNRSRTDQVLRAGINASGHVAHGGESLSKLAAEKVAFPIGRGIGWTVMGIARVVKGVGSYIIDDISGKRLGPRNSHDA